MRVRSAVVRVTAAVLAVGCITACADGDPTAAPGPAAAQDSARATAPGGADGAAGRAGTSAASARAGASCTAGKCTDTSRASGNGNRSGTGGGRHACSPSVSLDRYSDALDKTTFQGTFVGNLSALARDTDGSIAAVSDRSVLIGLDGRTHRPVRTAGLADEKGAVLDAEGLAVEPGGAYLVSSETEPSVRRYDRSGTLLGRLPVPDALRVAPAGRAQSNQTFEGLTLRPGGGTLTASMEGRLTGDGKDTAGRPLLRFQTWQRYGARGGSAPYRFGTAPYGSDSAPHGSDSAPSRSDSAPYRLGKQYAYPVDAGLGVSEIAALADGRLLVLERGFTAGVGNTVRLYLADPRRAADVSGVANLPDGKAVRAAHKKLLADLGACPSLGAPAHQPQTNPLLDNIEGMTVTGRAPGGRLRLLLVSDDNESPKQITRLYELTVRPGGH
ncbi:esterase-like activity of phytase family protein [Streptomyces albofaciens JCM 4342]|uniref:esterase-like activity of phytase family protein n=1 Tax=Streptomyces albofaciens TaxID=66866 RepID=UPI00123B8D94|nr:esterase-like activity of phytase family protein [Streptomyces albofaciens]KAA6221793.1 esterase-like activity of phytase family protein [Streptomyces albofaciens JCM 4342]